MRGGGIELASTHPYGDTPLPVEGLSADPGKLEKVLQTTAAECVRVQIPVLPNQPRLLDVSKAVRDQLA